MILVMSTKQMDTLVMMRRLDEGQVTMRQAAGVLGLSQRPVRRLRKRWQAGGSPELVHARCGRPSPRRIPYEPRAQALRTVAERYGDFGA
jgi:hypothetical protein